MVLSFIQIQQSCIFIFVIFAHISHFISLVVQYAFRDNLSHFHKIMVLLRQLTMQFFSILSKFMKLYRCLCSILILLRISWLLIIRLVEHFHSFYSFGINLFFSVLSLNLFSKMIRIILRLFSPHESIQFEIIIIVR